MVLRQFLFVVFAMFASIVVLAQELYTSGIDGCDEVHPKIFSEKSNVLKNGAAGIAFFSYQCGTAFNSVKKIKYVIGLNNKKFELKKTKPLTADYVGEFSGQGVSVSVKQVGETRYRPADIQEDNGKDYSGALIDAEFVNMLTPVQLVIKKGGESLTLSAKIQEEGEYYSNTVDNLWPTKVYDSESASAVLIYKYPQVRISEGFAEKEFASCRNSADTKDKLALCAEKLFATPEAHFMKMDCNNKNVGYSINLNNQHFNLKKTGGKSCDFLGNYVELSKNASEEALKVEIKKDRNISNMQLVLVSLYRGKSQKSLSAQLMKQVE